MIRNCWAHLVKSICLNKMFNKNFFDAEKMVQFMSSLPVTDRIENIYLDLKDRVAIMTHDDYFDREMHEWEKDNGFTSTFFLLTAQVKQMEFDRNADLQLHYDMSREDWIWAQIKEFEAHVGKKPLFNRNHRVFWREAHLDLANLAMHGIRADFSLLNSKPFRLCVQNRILPVWEVPYNVVDEPYVNVTKNVYCTYNVSGKMEDLFAKGITPVVGLFHPYLKDKVHWKRFFELAVKYGYKIMNVREFYEKYLKNR